MNSNTRYMAYAPEDSFVEAVHGLSAFNMDKTFEGFMTGALTGRISRGGAKCRDFLSIFQAVATFWMPVFSPERRSLMSSTHPGMFKTRLNRFYFSWFIAVRTAPNTTTSSGLARTVFMVSSFTFYDALCMVDRPSYGLYWKCDVLSAVRIVRELTTDATIECADLNSDISPLKVLQKVIGISDEDLQHDRYTFGGLFDVMVHTARAIVATSQLHAQHYEDHPEHREELADAQRPHVVYSRVIDGLARTFFYPETIMEKVLGSLEDCRLEKLKSARWFPSMKWMQREEKHSSVTLWRPVLNEVGASSEKIAGAASGSGSQEVGAPGASQRVSLDVRVQSSRQDGEGEDNDERTINATEAQSSTLGPTSSCLSAGTKRRATSPCSPDVHDDSEGGSNRRLPKRSRPNIV